MLCRINVVFFHALVGDDGNATSGSFHTAYGAADLDGFSGNNTWNRMAGKHAVSVHDPCHNLTICINIRCRNILIWSDDRKDTCGITTGKTYKLRSGKLGRINFDSPLGTAVRNIYNRTFKGHPGCKRFYFVHIGILMVTDAALARSTCAGMLNTVSLEYLNGAVIHTDRDRNLKFTFRVAKCCVIFVAETKSLCRLLQDREHIVIRIILFICHCYHSFENKYFFYLI